MDKKSDDRILVVDDDATSRKMLVRTLSSAGYDCYESDNGAETLKLGHGEQPSLLLLDFDMPGLDGAELLKRIRSDRDPAVAQMPAIMFAALSGKSSKRRYLEARADELANK